MVDLVTLVEIKAHLRISHSDEDALLEIYSKATQEYICNYINQDIPGLADSPPAPPESLKGVALLMIADLYENREGSAMVLSGGAGITPNPNVEKLMYPYRVDIGI